MGTFCSNQPFALEIIKTKQKKDSRFTSFIQVPRPPFTSCRLFILFFLIFILKVLRRSHKDGMSQMAMGPFQRKFHFLESKPPAAFTFAHTPFTPERGKKKKKQLPGDHLTYFARLPFRKRRVTDCVADCSSKILFPWRCCGSPNTPCCSRTSQSTQVPHWMPRHLGGEQSVPLFLRARCCKSRFKARCLNLAKAGHADGW